MAFDRGNNTAGTGSASVLPIAAGGTNANTALTAFSNLSEGKVVVAASGNVGIGTSSPSAPLDVNGNLAITGSARRITGDFSNATPANRVLFQTSTVNARTAVGVLPSGTGNQSALQTFGSSDITNTSLGSFQIEAGDVQIASGRTGTGTYLPMTFYTGGSERMRIDSSGNVGIGASSPARPLHISNVMRLQPRNGAPSSPGAGDIYFDSSDNKLKCYDGSTWQNLF
jgi:hypothetical protein